MRWLLNMLLVLPALAMGNESIPVDSSEDEIYFEARAPFDSDTLLETRIFGGTDVNNPYLQIYSLGVTESLRFSRFFFLGVQATKFFAEKSGTSIDLEKGLSDFGFRIDYQKPNWSGHGLIGITPFSGMVSLFGEGVVMMDLSLVAKGGVASYHGQPIGPSAGVAIDYHVGFSPLIGFSLAISWEVDKVASYPWVSRVGLRAGPTVRF